MEGMEGRKEKANEIGRKRRMDKRRKGGRKVLKKEMK